jgi:glycosyltransferase involved in cell wall biosynthesis
MLSGRAVVATCVGGIPEIVNDRETGLLVPVADPRSLANALRRVLTDEAIRTAFERKAQAFARKHLTWRVNAAAYNAIYHRIAARSDVA